MGFADDVSKFTATTLPKIEKIDEAQKEKIAALLKDKLGDEAKLITSITFDNEKLKFYDVKAPESVIAKLRAAGYLRE